MSARTALIARFYSRIAYSDMSTQAPFQASVQKRLYDLPTCLLEVWSERSPLSEWSDRPIAQNLRFRLTVEENGRFGRIKQKTIRGNQNLLGKIIEAVADYADKFLAEDNFSSLSHHLSIPNVPKLNQLNLSTLQLFDLVSSLEQCAIEVTILPTVELEVRRITPAWLKIAALVIATVGVTTSAVKLIFDRPALEFVTSSNRETGVVEPSPQNQNKGETISSASPRPTIPAPKQDPNIRPPAPAPISQAPTPIAPSPSATGTPAIRPAERSQPPAPLTKPSESEPEVRSPSPLPTPELSKDALEPKQSHTPENPLEDSQRSRRNPIAPPPAPEIATKPNANGSFRSDPPSNATAPENSDQNTQKYGQDNLRKPSPSSETTPPAAAVAPPIALPNRASTSGKVNQSRSVQPANPDRGGSSDNLPVPQAGIVAITSNIQIVSIETTLNEDIKASLSRYIKTTNLSDKASGEVVFDISLDRGKVEQVKLDESATTLKNNLIVESLRRSLLNWQTSASANGKIRLSLSVRASPR
jgi:Domain of unknown function (DUF4335)